MLGVIIHSNLCSSLLSRIEELRLSRIRLKEDENYRIYGYRWPNSFMLSHKQDYLDGKFHGYMSGSYSSSSSSSSYCDDDNCLIYFYEWSSLSGNQRKFFSYSNFYRFCSDSGIIVSSSDKSKLRSLSCSYVSCKCGKNELLISSTSVGLSNLLKASSVNV